MKEMRSYIFQLCFKQWSNKVVFLSALNPKAGFWSGESFLKDPLDLKSEDETKLVAIKFEAMQILFFAAVVA